MSAESQLCPFLIQKKIRDGTYLICKQHEQRNVVCRFFYICQNDGLSKLNVNVTPFDWKFCYEEKNKNAD